MARSAVLMLEDALGAELLLTGMGAAAPPVVAGRYEVLALHGRGAFGLVCRARDLRLHRQVALKLYPPLDDAYLENAALREAQALARLDHPNVVRIYDHDRGVVQAGDTELRCLFVSMEFIEGRSLRAWLAEAPRAPRDILQVLLAAGEGLAAAHEAGLIHRDFKPENVMIDAGGHVRVVDFGLARGQQPEGAPMAPVPHAPDLVGARLTNAGVAPGTPEYMAPEAMRGHANASSDQFSFAVTVWEALTGSLPGERPHSAITRDPAEELPRRLRAGLRRAMAVEPNRRYPELRRLLNLLRRQSNRRRRRVIAGLVVAASLGLLTAGAVLGERASASLRGSDPSPAPARAAAVPSASPGSAARCDTLAGTWYFDTVVVWANDTIGLRGVSGHYQLEIEPLGGCRVEATLTKTGHGGKDYQKSEYIRQGTREVEVEATEHGLELVSRFEIDNQDADSMTYDLRLVFDGDRIDGDFVHTDAGGLIRKGYLRGSRTRSIAKLSPEVSEASCASQCQIRCASPSSQRVCETVRCPSERDDVPDCGAPPANQAIPPLTRQLAQSTASELRAQRTETRARRRYCDRAATTITGRWRLTDADKAWTLDIAPGLDCELDITVRSEPSGDRQQLQGLTTGSGAWVVLEPDGLTPRWALIGWDPAFGVSRSGRALSANRSNQ